MSPIQWLRAQATLAQNNLCFYCHWPMWNGEDASLPVFKIVYGLTRRQANILRCTAEHLVPVSAGGLDSADNVVAACGKCNRLRARSFGALSSAEYKVLVERKALRGKWHGASFRKVIGGLPIAAGKPVPRRLNAVRPIGATSQATP